MHGLGFGPLPAWWTVWHSLGVLIIVAFVVAANLRGTSPQ